MDVRSERPECPGPWSKTYPLKPLKYWPQSNLHLFLNRTDQISSPLTADTNRPLLIRAPDPAAELLVAVQNFGVGMFKAIGHPRRDNRLARHHGL